MEVDYKEMLEFAKQEITNSSRIEHYPFRDRFTHTIRVLKWAERIQKEECGNLEVVKIACIFHDVGWDQTINHSIISKSIAEKYLKECNYDNEKLEMVLEAVENHNLRHDENLVGIESKIVMDADLLDEVGALSVIWDSMAAQIEEKKSYLEVYNRIKFYFGRLNRLDLLKTDTGKRYYRERLEVISQFLKELEFELY